MSRAIKFRVWDTRGKYFRRANIEGPKNSAWGITIDRGIFSLESTEGLIYQQWTGLQDKNGRDIYEGDIVHRFGHYSLMLVPSIDEYKEIKWWTEGGRWNYVPCYDCSLEIVGNIFEKPELLTNEP